MPKTIATGPDLLDLLENIKVAQYLESQTSDRLSTHLG